VAIFGGLAAFPACAQSLQERMSTCFACHGEKGQSQRPEVPSLGAQPALYTLIELVMFRDQLRVTEPMNERNSAVQRFRTASEDALWSTGKIELVFPRWGKITISLAMGGQQGI